MNIVTSLRRAKRILKRGKPMPNVQFEKNAAHRRHRRNQTTKLRQVADGRQDADVVDLITRPCTGWDVV